MCPVNVQQLVSLGAKAFRAGVGLQLEVHLQDGNIKLVTFTSCECSLLGARNSQALDTWQQEELMSLF